MTFHNHLILNDFYNQEQRLYLALGNKTIENHTVSIGVISQLFATVSFYVLIFSLYFSVCYPTGHILNHKWENCLTIDKKSWGYRRNAVLTEYMTIQELITQLASTVR